MMESTSTPGDGPDCSRFRTISRSRGGLHHDGVHLYSWRWSETYYSQDSTFSSPVLVSGLIIFAIVFKILFHHLSVLERLLPESCVLILVGTFFGVIIKTAFGEGVNEDGVNPFPKFG